ncbi:hypothetical protein BDV93DRAFT_525473 [Ceratobasidium sp. AG-I]|nr:hypothetical protein BDV93DRAFT_525473 [Ceratobasidium sp. AG-I]
MPLVEPARINDTLPPEILSSIFVIVVDDNIIDRSVDDGRYNLILRGLADNSDGTNEYPTLISSVCTYWRRVSVGIPYLWSYIDLMPGNVRLRNAEHVKLWLERSQGSPLRLRLGKGGEQAEVSEQSARVSIRNSLQHIDDQLASILLSSAPRLHSFTLKFGNFDFAKEALLALLPKEGQHPIRELAIRRNKSLITRVSQILPRTEWNRLLEPLHVLHLENIDIRANSISCQNLVELHLVHPWNYSLARFAEIFECNPGLRTILLNRPMFSDDQPSPTAPINMPCLRCIKLSANQELATSILKLLVPGPHGLDLHLEYRDEADGFMDAIIPFLQRTNVESLYLEARKVSLLPILTAVPHLQTLGLSEFNLNAGTFAGLESAANLVPELHTIDLNNCSFNNYTTLCPGMHTLLSRPSVQRVRQNNGPGNLRRLFIQLLEEGGFGATISTLVLGFEARASPFR